MIYPLNKQLAMELTGGTIRSWPNDGQLPVVSLSIKCGILHKIGIANWIPSTHVSTIFAALGHFLYLIVAGSVLNVVSLYFIICCTMWILFGSTFLFDFLDFCLPFFYLSMLLYFCMWMLLVLHPRHCL